MTKAELVEKVASATKMTKAEAGRAIDATIEAIKGALKKGQKVTLVGFGTFSISRRKPRKGRNPQTGKEIHIPAMKVPRFTAGKALKNIVR